MASTADDLEVEAAIELAYWKFEVHVSRGSPLRDRMAFKAAVRKLVNTAREKPETKPEEPPHQCDDEDCQRCFHLGALAADGAVPVAPTEEEFLMAGRDFPSSLTHRGAMPYGTLIPRPKSGHEKP
jgi:hypothetical protein